MGNVVSIEVAPAEAIGAILPKYFAITGANNKVIDSLITFESVNFARFIHYASGILFFDALVMLGLHYLRANERSVTFGIIRM